MAEATWNAKIDEMMTPLRNTMETQGWGLDDIVNKLTAVDAKIEVVDTRLDNIS